MLSRRKFETEAVAAGVPVYLVPGLIRYRFDHALPGDALSAILANDLFSAVQYADPIVLQSLRPISQFIYLHCPAISWGSRENVTHWAGEYPTREEQHA